jgi:hypothetical protein
MMKKSVVPLFDELVTKAKGKMVSLWWKWSKFCIISGFSLRALMC